MADCSCIRTCEIFQSMEGGSVSSSPCPALPNSHLKPVLPCLSVTVPSKQTCLKVLLLSARLPPFLTLTLLVSTNALTWSSYYCSSGHMATVANTLTACYCLDNCVLNLSCHFSNRLSYEVWHLLWPQKLGF